MKTYDNISLKEYNTFGIDVKARRLLVLEEGDAVPQLEESYLIVGAGSDMVFTRDYEGTVVMLSEEWKEVCEDSTSVRVWAGVKMDKLIQWTLDRGLYGLENLSAIPGTVGASAVQNVGAYGAEAKDFIERVEAYDLHERCSVDFTAEQCRFGYRTSLFKEHPGRWLILRVTYHLSRNYVPNLGYRALEGLPHDTASELRQAIIDLRWQKLPRPEEHGSAGSFFKNPVVEASVAERLKAEYPDMPLYPGNKLSAGWLIDRCGWKGKTLGHAGVWPQNALVLYNESGCTGPEVVALATAIQNDVERQFGIVLVPEAIII